VAHSPDHRLPHSGHPAARRRRVRVVFGSGLLLLATLAGTGAAQAAQDATVVPSSFAEAAPASYVPYNVSITNTGNSTLTQVSLSIDKPNHAAYRDVRPDADCSASAGGVTCRLANIAAGSPSIDLTFYFEVTGSAGDSLVFPAAGTKLLVKENQTDPNDPGRTSSYSASRSVTVAIVNDPDTTTTYVPPDGGTFGTSGTDIDTGSKLGSGNQQATVVDVPATGDWILVNIREYAGDQGCSTRKRSCFGEISDTDVPITKGQLGIWVRWDKSILPKGKNAKNLGVAHQFDGSNAWVELKICRTADPRDDAPCREPGVVLSDGDIFVKTWIKSNGRTKGF
jgi:hypothetical protein